MKGEYEVEYENVATDEKPPVYDHTQAFITRDEKTRSAAPNLLELLSGCNLNSLSNDPIELGIQYQVIVSACLLLSYFFQMIVSLFSLLFGDNGETLAFMSILIHGAVFIRLLSVEHSHKFLLVTYTGQFLVSTILAVYGMLYTWSPSFCREFASQCQNNLGLLQVVGSTVLIGNVFLQARVWLIFRKVYKHAEMNENIKKQTNSVMLV